MGEIIPLAAERKFDILDPGIPKRLLQQPVASALGSERKEEEVTTAMKVLTNAKVGRPDDLLVELLKLGLQQDRIILLELHRLITLIWRENIFHRVGKTRSLLFSTKPMTRRSAEGIVASCSCPTRVRCSLKEWIGDVAITLRPRACYRRSSMDFD